MYLNEKNQNVISNPSMKAQQTPSRGKKTNSLTNNLTTTETALQTVLRKKKKKCTNNSVQIVILSYDQDRDSQLHTTP